MKYSFVLPAYKATYLKEAIDSILQQTYKDFELIIVNDASPEDLYSIVKSYDDPRIQYYVNKENIGGKDLVAQWNHSISYAKGAYLILASDDDVYDCEFLERMDKLIVRYPKANIFRPRVKTINEYGEIVGVEGYLKEYSSDIEFLQAWVNGWIGSGIPFYIFKREPLLEIGGFAQYPLAWFSDDATVLKLSNNGVVSSSDVLFSFRWSGMSISSKKNSLRSLELKLLATNLFYHETLTYLDGVDTDSEMEKFIKQSIRATFTKLIYANKTIGQVSNASWVDVTYSLPMIRKCDFVPFRNFILWYIKFSIRSLMGML